MKITVLMELLLTGSYPLSTDLIHHALAAPLHAESKLNVFSLLAHRRE